MSSSEPKHIPSVPFFYAHNSRSQSLIEKRLQQIADAHNVTDDFALIEPLVVTTKCLVGQLRQFNQVIKEFDHKIKELFKSHSDHFSLPGAGAQLAPRLLSLFGSDRSRWADAADIQKYSGIAPVIERSGQSVWVHRRLSRPIFICQTFHEPSAPSHSSGYASFGPAGRPTSLTMNLSTFTPLKNAILPFPQLDGPPQTWRGPRSGKEAVYAGFDLEPA